MLNYRLAEVNPHLCTSVGVKKSTPLEAEARCLSRSELVWDGPSRLLTGSTADTRLRP